MGKGEREVSASTNWARAWTCGREDLDAYLSQDNAVVLSVRVRIIQPPGGIFFLDRRWRVRSNPIAIATNSKILIWFRLGSSSCSPLSL